MWEVINKLRNKEYVRPDSKSATENGNHIAKFSVKPNIPDAHPYSLTPAFGSMLYDKLVRKN